MNAQTPDLAFHEQLASIEERVSRLLVLVDKLAAENTELRKREKSLTHEYLELRTRNDKAGNQLEAMISRLKNQQNGSA